MTPEQTAQREKALAARDAMFTSLKTRLMEVVGSEARFVLRDACEHLEFYPRFSREIETHAYIGGMMSFGETFGSRLGKWIEQNLEKVTPEEIDAYGEDALQVQQIIEEHSGQVWGESEPGHGSTFYVVLPKALGVS